MTLARILTAALMSLTLGCIRSSDSLPPTHADVPYGPFARTVLDFWRAPTDGPTPVVVNIHGGGWIRQDKTVGRETVREYLERGVSFVSINYRLLDEAVLPAPVHDAARAIQFLRFKALEWGIDESRIGLTGGSAGATTAMWILFHDDLAAPDDSDPVRRESSRVSAAAVRSGQTSIDPLVIANWIGREATLHPMISRAVGESKIGDALSRYSEHQAIYQEFSPYNHLDASDPPLFMAYPADLRLPARDPAHGIHHAMFGIRLKEKADRLGHETHLLIDGVTAASEFGDITGFLFAKLLSN